MTLPYAHLQVDRQLAEFYSTAFHQQRKLDCTLAASLCLYRRSMCMSPCLSLFTAGPDVHRFAICLLPQHLGGQVTRCPCESCNTTHIKHTMTDILTTTQAFVDTHMTGEGVCNEL